MVNDFKYIRVQILSLIIFSHETETEKKNEYFKTKPRITIKTVEIAYAYQLYLL